MLSLPIQIALLLMYPTGCPVKFMVCSEANVFKHFFGNAHPITSRQNSYRLVECSLCRLHSRYIEDRLSPYSSSVGTALPVLPQGGSSNPDQTNFYTLIVSIFSFFDVVSDEAEYVLSKSLLCLKKSSNSISSQSPNLLE